MGKVSHFRLLGLFLANKSDRTTYDAQSGFQGGRNFYIIGHSTRAAPRASVRRSECTKLDSFGCVSRFPFFIFYFIFLFYFFIP